VFTYVPGIINSSAGKVDTSRCLAHSDNIACYEAQVAHPHTIILSASVRSRCFLILMAASATSATAAITIHVRDFICMPSWTGLAGESDSPTIRKHLDGIMRLTCSLLAYGHIKRPPVIDLNG
jgi:hypothetical protein